MKATTKEPLEIKVTTETPEFQSWFAGLVKIHTDYMNTNFPRNQKDEFKLDDGQRYIRVYRFTGNQNLCHCFIDKTNGNVLKSAGWSAPEKKNPRGSIFDESNGLAKVTWCGVAYLR